MGRTASRSIPVVLATALLVVLAAPAAAGARTEATVPEPPGVTAPDAATGTTTEPPEPTTADDGSITGTVVGPDGALEAVTVEVFDTAFPGGPRWTTTTGSDGAFAVSGLPARDHEVRFRAPGGSGLSDEWFRSATLHRDAEAVTVGAGATVDLGETRLDPPRPATTVGVGRSSSCALRPDGAVDCWGGATLVPATHLPGPYDAIAVDYDGTVCGILTDGSGVLCSSRYEERLHIGSFTAVDSQCGILANTLRPKCWDRNLPSGIGPLSVVSGLCGLNEIDGAIECFPTNNEVVRRPGPYLDFDEGRYNHSCGILAADGSIECWGENPYGAAEPRPGPFIDVAVGEAHTCGILAVDGSAQCWGENYDGQAEDRPGPFTSIVSTWDHNCAVRATDGTVDCWGDDHGGKLGTEPTVASDPPNLAPLVGVPFSHQLDVAGDPTPVLELLGDLPAGLTFDPGTATFSGTPTASEATTVPVRASSVRGVGEATLQLRVSSPRTIAGTVVDGDGDPVEGAAVLGYADGDGWTPSSTATTAADGTYALEGLADGVHRVAVVPPAGSGLAVTWWLGAAGRTDATPLAIDGGTAHAGIDVTLPGTAAIAGTVTDAADDPVDGAVVAAHQPGVPWVPLASTTTGADGTYLLEGLTPGAQEVRFSPAPPMTGEWWADSALRAGSTAVTTTAGATTTAIDARLSGPGAIAGTVTGPDGPLAGAVVAAFDADDGVAPTVTATTGADGTYSLAPLPSGPYVVRFRSPPGAGLVDEWHGDALTRVFAEGVSVVDDTTTTDVDAELGPYGPEVAPTVLGAGWNHTCHLRPAGDVACWGDAGGGKSDDQVGPFLSISAGREHTCGIIAADRSIDCWGWTDGPRAGTFLAVASGDDHTCALVASDRSIDCWGDDDHGQAADRSGTFLAVAAGYDHTCGLRADGAIDCWGRDHLGQAEDRPGPYAAIGAGAFHTCAVRHADGGVECWGNDDYGQASGTAAGPAIAVDGGYQHTCALLVDGSVDCWGYTPFGQASDRTGPFTAVATGANHTCAVLDADGGVECWGFDNYGQASPPTG